MNFAIGLYRLAKVIKWFGRLIAGPWVIFLFTQISSDKSRVLDGFIKGDEFIWIIFVSPFVLIAITESIGWVLEGFAND